MGRNGVVVLGALLPVLACSSFGEEGQSPPTTDPGTTPDDPKKNAPPPPAATPPASELTEQFGYFVTEKGSDESGVGTRASPFKSIGKGLSKAKVDGKRVYVCAGRYIEALTLEDGVSMIGGYDCSQVEWSNSAKKSRVESPTSPALRAKDIKTLTRFEGFDVLAPDAVDPSGSSIGLIAERSDKLTIVSSRIAAGSGAAGKAGVEGVQLTQTGSVNGLGGSPENEYCGFPPCGPPVQTPIAKPGPAGGTSTCSGAAGHNGGAGGRGGSAGMYRALESTVVPNNYFWQTQTAAGGGESKSGAAGAEGPSGAPTPSGSLSANGYAPANGLPGGHGKPGEGGAGGHAAGPPTPDPKFREGEYWYARAGSSGGGGGCPGLAGTPGMGGGASIGAILVLSSVSIEKSAFESGAGGAGGRGTFGSRPTPGGLGATGSAAPGLPGGDGGASGTSGSGGGGPSFAIAHSGPAPNLVASTTKAGAGGAGVAEETAEGKVLPATGKGESKEVFSF